jgi:amino-acid N-acetyltransferase
VTQIVVDRARLADVEAMKAILDDYASTGDLLARSRLALYEGLRDFVVAREGNEIVGLSALHICWADLGEVRSLAVKRDHLRRGIGQTLVQHCLTDAIELGLQRVFALTYRPGFFHTLGFSDVEKSELPHKVWQDCIHCAKFPECDEEAVMRVMTGPTAGTVDPGPGG